MAASAMVAQPIDSLPSSSRPTMANSIMPNPNPMNIHQALSPASSTNDSGYATGSGPRIHRGSNQSNTSLRAGFYGNQSHLSHGSNPGTIASANSYVSFGMGENLPTYGDSTGTKGWGTGNNFEKSTRNPSVPGAYGSSTGTKGWGTGNSFESHAYLSPNFVVKSGSRRGSNVSGQSGQFGQSFGGANLNRVPSNAVSTTSRVSRSPNLGDKVKAGVEAVTSKFKKSDA